MGRRVKKKIRAPKKKSSKGLEDGKTGLLGDKLRSLQYNTVKEAKQKKNIKKRKWRREMGFRIRPA